MVITFFNSLNGYLEALRKICIMLQKKAVKMCEKTKHTSNGKCRIKRKRHNHGSSTEYYKLMAREKSRSETFNVIVGKLRVELPKSCKTYVDDKAKFVYLGRLNVTNDGRLLTN